MSQTDKISMIAIITELQNTIHSNNVKAGWWTDLKTYNPVKKDVSQFLSKLCLVHSEVSEACEGFRKSLMDDHLPHRQMAEVELADTIIRILDLAGAYELDVAGAIFEKLEYNKNRADHKMENRLKAGGKAE